MSEMSVENTNIGSMRGQFDPYRKKSLNGGKTMSLDTRRV